MINNKQTIITIDGPAGAGKGTIGKGLAARIHWNYLDTGALYRAVAVEALRNKIVWEKQQEIEQFILGLSIDVKTDLKNTCVYINGKDVSAELRTPQVSQVASDISKWPKVRTVLLETQKNIGNQGHFVVEGRDMGTVIFPKAPLKFFLKADLKIRAQRRWKELSEKGNNISLKDVEESILKRDQNDEKRSLSPLKPAHDAILIYNNELGINEILDLVETKARQTFKI